MRKPPSHFSLPRCLTAGQSQGQGLVEYVILISVIGLSTVIGLTLFGGSVQGGFIKACAKMGNNECQAAQIETPIAAGTMTPTLAVSVTPSLVPTATSTLSEPEPTRQPIVPILTVVPAPTIELLTMRIKVVLNNSGGKNNPGGIQVVIHDTAGVYVAEGVTDAKGDISFSVQRGSYLVDTLYANVWQTDGPISVSNSKENVIHR